MSNPNQDAPNTTPAADGKSQLNAALEEYRLNADDFEEHPEFDRPLSAVANDAAEQKPAPAPEGKAAPAEKSKHSEYLIGEARKYGFTDDEIGSMSSADLRREVLEFKKYDRREEAIPPSSTSPPAGSPASPAPTGEASHPQAGDKPLIDWGKDSDEWIEPEFQAKLEGVLGPIVRELREAREELAALKGHVVQEAQQRHHNAIDQAFAKLKLPAFGSGSLGEASPEEAKRRRAVVMLAVEEAKAGADFFKALEANARTMFGSLGAAAPQESEPQTPKRSAPAKDPETGRFVKPEEWEQATVQRPTNRKGSPEPQGEAKAARSIHALVSQAARSGGYASVNGEFDESVLPD